MIKLTSRIIENINHGDKSNFDFFFFLNVFKFLMNYFTLFEFSFQTKYQMELRNNQGVNKQDKDENNLQIRKLSN